MVRQLWRCAPEILSVFTEHSPTTILIHEFGLIIYPVIPVCIKCKILRSPYCIYKFSRLAFIKGTLFIFSRQEVKSIEFVTVAYIAKTSALLCNIFVVHLSFKEE